MSYKWSPEEEHLLRLLRPTNTYQEIANEFSKRLDRNLAGFRTERTAESIRKKCDRDNIKPDNAEKMNEDIVDRFSLIDSVTKEYSSRAVHRSRGLVQGTKKILALSDIHFPFTQESMLKAAITEHSDADVVVLNGDILDGYMFSTFKKNKRIAALKEYRCTFSLVKMLRELFPIVVLTEGNHDARPARSLQSAEMSKEQTQVLRPNLIARIANGEELDESGMLTEKHDFDNVLYDPVDSWYNLVGKTIFVHPHGRGSAKPGYTVEKCYNYFSTRYEPHEFDSIVCGHTHKIYKGIIGGKLLMEQGCLATVQSYAHSPRMDFIKNGMNGYAVIYQDEDGNTDFNQSHVVYLGEVMPPKKPII